MANVDDLKGRHEAQNIVEAAICAYWAQNEHYRQMFLNDVHENFKAMAAELGYRVEKIEAAAPALVPEEA